jgi:3,4-dihydroxy 2-butanone 4-phosphate synthase/GTP cyclohydrolase II
MVICEIINDDGTMARRDDLLKFAKTHNMKISSVEKLVQLIQNGI